MRDDLSRVLVLGPVAVPAPDGSLVAPRGGRAAALVVALALSGGRPVPVASLARDLWDGDGPRDPRAALQSLVSRLRADARAGLIASRGGGYALDAGSDLADARRLLDAGRAALSRCDAAAAAAVAREGLAAWRDGDDPQLDPDGPIVRALAAEAGRLRADLTALLRDAAGATGDHETVLALSERALRVDPTDEEAAFALMTAYAALGRSDDGVRVYSRLRHALSVELGTDPGPDLVRLGAQLLAARADTPPAVPVSGSAPDPGRVPPLPTADPAVVRSRTVLGVRTPATPLLGREDDVAAVERELATSRVVTVLGAGGLGKTRLAQEIAARSTVPFVAVVELAGIRTDDDVVVALADGLGLAPTGTGRLADRVQAALSTSQVLDHVRHREGLLVLDNCEHVVDGAARWVADLLDAAPRLRVLTTSRAPLLVAGEQVYPLAPLGTLDGHGPAVRLFTQRARAVRPGVDLPVDVIVRLCRRLDGLPLAIELAAARTRTMSVEEIERHLDERFALLRAADRLAPDRHRTLEAVIEWSWNLLGPLEQQVLARLSLLPDGLSPDAAVAIGSLGEGDARRWDVLDAVDGLVTQSLATVTEHEGSVRYRLLETVREFGVLRLHRVGETDTALAVALDWGRAFAADRGLALLGPGQVRAMADLRREQENLLFVLREAEGQGRPDVVVVVFSALGGAWSLLGAEEKIAGLIDAVLSVFPGWQVPGRDIDAAVFALAAVGAVAVFTFGQAGSRAMARLTRLLRRTDVGPRARALGETVLCAPELAAEQCARLRSSRDPLVSMLGAMLTAQTEENAGRIAEAMGWAGRAFEQADARGTVAERALIATFLASCASEIADVEGVAHWSGIAREGLGILRAEESLRVLDWIEMCAALTTADLQRAEELCTRLEAGTSSGGVENEFSSLAMAYRAEIAHLRGDEEAALAGYESAARHPVPAAAEEGFVPPLSGVPDEAFVSPWFAIVSAAWLNRLTLGGRFERAATVAEELGGQLVHGHERRPGFIDRPVVGTAVLAIGAHLALGAGRAEDGAWFVAQGERMGARQDFPSLQHGPVTQALADRHGPEPLRVARACVAELDDQTADAELFARLAAGRVTGAAPTDTGTG